MKSHELPRLRSDETTPSLLRLALDSSADEPTGGELEGIATALGLAVGPTLPPAPPPTPLSSSAVALAKWKLLSAVAVPALVGAIGGAAVLKLASPARTSSSLRTGDTREVSQNPTVQQSFSTASPTTQPVLPIAPSSDSPVATPAFDPSSSPSASPAKRWRFPERTPAPPTAIPAASALADPPEASPQPRPASEVALLDRAKALVESDPAAALALADRHASTFPAGLLQQEAEVIAVEALVRAGRTSAAADRLSRFRRRFPNSAYLLHLESMTGQSR